MAIKKVRMYVKNVAIDVFYKKDIDFTLSHQAVACFSGFPDFVGPTPLTYLFAANNRIVFQPHVVGTFDSQGEFCPDGIKTTMLLLNHAIWDAAGSSYPDGQEICFPWQCNSLILAGHSFGGIIALRYFNCLQNLHSIILTSPALHYSKRFGCKENGPEHYENVRMQYPYTYRLAPVSSWNGILSGEDEIPSRPHGAVNNILILYGENDKYFDMDAVRQTVPRLVSSYVSARELSLQILPDVGHPLIELLQCNEAQKGILKVCFGDVNDEGYNN